MPQEIKYFLLSDAAADPAKVDQKRFNFFSTTKLNSKQIGIRRKCMVNLYLEH
jgi:hypothetical protein